MSGFFRTFFCFKSWSLFMLTPRKNGDLATLQYGGSSCCLTKYKPYLHRHLFFVLAYPGIFCPWPLVVFAFVSKKIDNFGFQNPIKMGWIVLEKSAWKSVHRISAYTVRLRATPSSHAFCPVSLDMWCMVDMLDEVRHCTHKIMSSFYSLAYLCSLGAS